MTDTLVHPWMIDPRDGLPLRAVGVVAGRPVWPVMGASEDDEDEDESDDEDEDESDDEDADDPYADLDEAGLRAKLTEISKSKKRDIARIKRMRAKAKDTTKDKPSDDDKDRKFTRAELDEMRAEAEESTRTAAHAHVIRHAATSALREAGFEFPADKDARSAKLRRALKLMDTDDVEVDDDGEVIGLDDAIDELKSEFPELFGKGAPRRQVKRPGNVNGNGKPGERKKSVTERQAEALFGKS
jgi:hypothetical protein